MTDLIDCPNFGISKYISRTTSDVSLCSDVCQSNVNSRSSSAQGGSFGLPSLVDLIVELIVDHLDELKTLEDVPYALVEVIATQMAQRGRFDDENIHLFHLLESLDFSYSRITDNGICAFVTRYAPNCTFLNLTSTEISDYSLRMVAKCMPNLCHLNLSYCEVVTDAGIRDVSYHCGNLQFLALCHLPHLTKKSIQYVTKIPNLKHLNLSQCPQITCSELHCSDCPTLKELLFSHSFLSQVSMMNLMTHCFNIAYLSLNYCHFVNDALLGRLLRILPELECISLVCNTSLTEEGVRFLAYHENLKQVHISENPQIGLSLIRKLSIQTPIKFIGSEIQIFFMRDRTTRAPFALRFNDLDTFAEVRKKVETCISTENQQSHPSNRVADDNSFQLLRITYRKNGTKRPGPMLSSAIDSQLIKEVVDKKRHLYIGQYKQSFLRPEPLSIAIGDPSSTCNLFLLLRKWNSERSEPENLRDVWIPSNFTLRDFKQFLSSRNVVDFPPEKILFVEEETQMRINLLLTDDTPLSVYGIISGDILHIEELEPDFHFDSGGSIVRSHTQEYFKNNAFKITVHETDESFLLRQHHLGEYSSSSAFKFELTVWYNWTFLELKQKVSEKVGIDLEYLHLSTRVEPFNQLRGNEHPVYQVLSGNLWLLLDVNSKDMASEKTCLSLYLPSPDGSHPETYNLSVRKNAPLYVIQEKIMSTLGIPEGQQLISRISKKEVSQWKEGKIPLLRSRLINFEQTVAQAALKNIRVDTIYKPFGIGEIILQAVKFSSWNKTPFHSHLKWNDVAFISIPRPFAARDIYQALRCISTNSNNKPLKVARITAMNTRIYRENFVEIKEDQTLDLDLWRSLDIICWGFQ